MEPNGGAHGGACRLKGDVPMSWDLRETMKSEASSTAVESLLRTLDDAAEWENRAASRVRAFAASSDRPSTTGSRPELGVAPLKSTG